VYSRHRASEHGLPLLQSEFGTTTTKKFWELGRTRLGDGEASNADYSNAHHASGGYGGEDWDGDDI
jgi:hypothetical protein